MTPLATCLLVTTTQHNTVWPSLYSRILWPFNQALNTLATLQPTTLAATSQIRRILEHNAAQHHSPVQYVCS